MKRFNVGSINWKCNIQCCELVAIAQRFSTKYCQIVNIAVLQRRGI
jgi:hypothetical protein